MTGGGFEKGALVVPSAAGVGALPIFFSACRRNRCRFVGLFADQKTPQATHAHTSSEPCQGLVSYGENIATLCHGEGLEEKGDGRWSRRWEGDENMSVGCCRQ